ncbi:MAG: shikimate dehydrogenase [Ginsengibacter sp.]
MKTYGLIGKTLGHSFSRNFFSDLFSTNDLMDCEYQNFELSDLQREIPVLKKMSGLSGLNVTIPYKTAIIPFLDNMTDDCRKINACNCIEINNGKWTGHNTDVIGFEKSFAPALKPEHKKALVLGDGGAAGAVKFVLNKLHIPFLTVSRKMHSGTDYINYENLNVDLISEYNIIINTTPLGMFPKVDEAPDVPYQFINKLNYLYDLIYNPSKTLFLSKGEEKGATIQNGADMLVIQAEESWRIWNT